MTKASRSLKDNMTNQPIKKSDEIIKNILKEILQDVDEGIKKNEELDQKEKDGSPKK